MDERPNGTTTYGPSTVKRARRTRAEMNVLDEAIVRAVELEAPTTLRSVFYRVVSAGAISKTEDSYRAVGRRLKELRRTGRVSYSDITDGTRWITAPTTFDSIDDALHTTAVLYRRRLWTESTFNLQLFTEKDAISGVVLPVTEEWDVPLGVLRGYVSESFAWTVAQSMRLHKVNVVAQLGDHDPSGLGAWTNFASKVREFTRTAIHIDFVRLAVTEAQIADMALPTRPTKGSDPRARNFTGGSVEVDAIPPTVLREIVTGWITEYVDADALEITKTVEAEERRVLLNMVGRAS